MVILKAVSRGFTLLFSMFDSIVYRFYLYNIGLFI